MTIDLKKFCIDLDDPRVYLHAPFNLNGHTFATTGHACIRVDLDDSCADLVEEKRDLLTKSLDRYFVGIESVKFDAFPVLPDLVYCDCKACGGTGFMIARECEECDGEGELTLSSDYNDYEVDCHSCSGSGEIKIRNTKAKCVECDGNKEVIDHFKNYIKLGSSRVNNFILKPFLELPNAMYSYKGDYTYAIKFDGGYGIVMAVRD